MPEPRTISSCRILTSALGRALLAFKQHALFRVDTGFNAGFASLYVRLLSVSSKTWLRIGRPPGSVS